VHAFVFLSNHFHLLATFRDARQAARFTGFLKAQLARRIRRIRGQVGEVVWGKRYALALVSTEPEAQVSRLQYLLRQGVKEGLVADPLDWPGPSSWHALATGEPLVGFWLPLDAIRPNSPPDFTSPKAEPEVLELCPLPAWAQLPEPLQRQLFLDLLDQVRQEARQHANSSQPRTPPHLGLVDLRPRPAPQRTDPLPLVHAASRKVRSLYEHAYATFFAAYRRAADALKCGLPPIPFPPGSFPRPAPFVPSQPP
jgi:hypothetical protein